MIAAGSGRWLTGAFLAAVLLSAATARATQPLCELSPAALDLLLAGVQARHPDFDDRVTVLASRYLGCTVYATDPLHAETIDWFPYRQTNCTLLVLYVAALANSHSLAEAREHMRRLHYRNGRVSFASRYHFTADRITDPDNAYSQECTAQLVRSPDHVRRVSCVLNQRQDGTPTFAGRLHGWQRRVSLAYVPREHFVPDLLRPLPSVIGVAFLKRANWPAGILVGHEGLLVQGDLLHSSPGRGVCLQPHYLERHFAASDWEGVCFFRLLPVR